MCVEVEDASSASLRGKGDAGSVLPQVWKPRDEGCSKLNTNLGVLGDVGCAMGAACKDKEGIVLGYVVEHVGLYWDRTCRWPKQKPCHWGCILRERWGIPMSWWRVIA